MLFKINTNVRGATASSYSIRQTSIAFKKPNLFVHVCCTGKKQQVNETDTSICVLFPVKDVFNEMLTCHLKEIKVSANFILVAGMLL